MTECTWPRYESHKIVQAAKIIGIERDAEDNIVIWTRPAGQEFDNVLPERFEPTVAAMAKQAVIGGWAVHYPDGFKSISPEKQFDEGYTRIP